MPVTGMEMPGVWNPLISTEEHGLVHNRNELCRILRMPDTGERIDHLRDLAGRLGASTIPLYPGHGEASLPEIVQNIHGALQTQAMIATLRTTTRYLMATVALVAVSVAGVIAAS